MEFLSPTLPRYEQSHGLLSSAAIVQEVFLKSLNTSYIGRMSGQKQIFHKLDNDPQPIQEESINTPHKKKRIDFSRFRGSALTELKQTVINEEDMRYMNLSSFTNENQELARETNCIMLCGDNVAKSKCLLEMLNESTLEIYTLGEGGLFNCLIVSINFDTVTAEIEFNEIPANREIIISIGKFKLLLEHEKRKIVEHWYDQIVKMHSQSKGKILTLTKAIENNEFYKERLETEQFFTKHCETGDILLFQDDHFFAKAQRFFTRSNFDHVGMVVKDSNLGILIFEANSGSGVCLTPWRYVIRYGWYKSIPKISWRRLMKVDRNKEFNDKVQKFILQNLQKNYHISFAKITAHESVIRQVGNPSKNQPVPKGNEDESGFFCSELAATVYKELGLLTRDKESENYQPACKFYPKDFSERGERKLDKGELSPEYTIFFDDNLLKLTYKGMIRDN